MVCGLYTYIVKKEISFPNKKSMEELLKFYNKDDEKSFRDEMFEINKGNQLASKMQLLILMGLLKLFLFLAHNGMSALTKTDSRLNSLTLQSVLI